MYGERERQTDREGGDRESKGTPCYQHDLRICIYIYIYIPAWWLECSPMARVQSQVKFKKWYLMLPYLTLCIIRYGSRVKWSNPGKVVALSPAPWCSSYRKGSLWVTLDYGHQLYFIYIYIYIYIPSSHADSTV